LLSDKIREYESPSRPRNVGITTDETDETIAETNIQYKSDGEASETFLAFASHYLMELANTKIDQRLGA